ncbi:endoglucanase [Streptomyces sp. DvalAA-14]|uniref:glycoside hydrolase family 9 protein n=1 Tax=unclassified Streptomyces TaxID=2593676 RepID=UPI00081BA4BA|nr:MULTISPECIES: glycoside hydrolase family 9 protein [unclassified Streptomyces]MYS24137.1 glycoside hydrolase [Streptomyces sp. SID4948]SCE42914.1 endoglucanase [Streptomyces sp. DvalAA-14]
MPFRRRRSTRATVTGLTAAALLAGLSLTGGAEPAQAATGGLVRVNQVGYAGGGAKEAFLLAKSAVSGAKWRLLNSRGKAVAAGRTKASLGTWNAAYPAVYLIDFSSVTARGTYHLVVDGAAEGSSPAFTIGSSSAVLAGPAADATTFFQAQRDGADTIPGQLGRGPSHLNDAHASVYAWPAFTDPDSDTITAAPRKIGGPVDVSGGWFDAGDLLKFTETTSYAVAALQIAALHTGAGPKSALGAEAQHGLDWLDKMWDPKTKTLYIQVGLGSGTDSGSVVGDHDVWRLPEQDDTDSADPFLRDRPVFRAGAPGSRISPNQAGRLAADFALAAQRYAATGRAADRARARGYLATAAQIYALADTHPKGQLVTAVPFGYYPETSWQDDLAFGGAELALAAQKLRDPRASAWLAQAATWAKGHQSEADADTLNMYDTSALADLDLARAEQAAGRPKGLAASYDQLIGYVKGQLGTGQRRAQADPFHAGAIYDDFDADSHTMGLAATVQLYRSVTGDTSYDRFGTEQLDWLLGANAWGSSFMVGEGSTFPECTAGELGNLAGSLNGTRPLEVGAIVNGPNGTGQFDGGLGDYLDGMRPCPASGDAFAAFTGHGSTYTDDVRSWQSSEPALDMDASGLLAFYLSK